MTFIAIIHQEDGLFVAQCPETGTTSQGKSMEEALKNLQEANALYLEEFPDSVAGGRPFITTFEAAHV